jgi:large repetitive protein
VQDLPVLPDASGPHDASVDQRRPPSDDARAHPDGGPDDATSPRDRRDDTEGAASLDAGADAPREAKAVDAGICDAASQACTYELAVLADHPIAYWRMTEPGGDVARDFSGHGHAGSYTACTLGAPGPIAGDAETAASFNGVSSLMTGPNLSFTGNAPYSIEAWARVAVLPAADGGFAQILNDESQAGDRQGYALFVDGLGSWGFERYVDASNANADLLTGDASASADFTYLVGTYDGTTLRLYVDSVLALTEDDSRVAVDSGVDFTVGGVADATKFFNGVIGEVAVYDSALTQPSIAAHYHASGR